jgi:hypothetical protein
MAYVTIHGFMLDGPARGTELPLSDLVDPNVALAYEAVTVELVDGSTAYYDLDPDMQTVGLSDEGYKVALGFRHALTVP